MTNEEIRRELFRLENEADRLATCSHVIGDETRDLSCQIRELRESIDDPEPEPVPPVVLRNAVLLENPNLERWPGASADHCFARGVQDMIQHNGRITGGGGDYHVNQGPPWIWSFSVEEMFRTDYVPAEEIVDTFYEYDNAIWVVSKDPRRRPAGSVYTKEATAWEEYAVIPDMIHAASFAKTSFQCFVIANKLNHAAELLLWDGGTKWLTIERDPKIQFKEVIAIEEDVFVFGSFDGNSKIFQFDGSTLASLCDPFDQPRFGAPGRVIEYMGGILYGDHISANTYYLGGRARKLYYLNPDTLEASIVVTFNAEYVRDIVIRNCPYIMTVVAGNGDLRDMTEFPCCIWKLAPDLSGRELVAGVLFPALPFSFEILNGKFYVAVGSRGREYADVDSGNVYRLTA